MWLQMVSISVGAAAGALLRWGLTLHTPAASSPVPMGTLFANLLGAYLIGVAIAVFSTSSSVPQSLKLLVITGFLGSLTTFSSFSAEMVALLQEGRWSWAWVGVFAHVVGSLAFTFGGIGTVVLFRLVAR